jgi:hypothetical protein
VTSIVFLFMNLQYSIMQNVLYSRNLENEEILGEISLQIYKTVSPI